MNVLLIEPDPGHAALVQDFIYGARDVSLEIVSRLRVALDRLAAGGIDLVLLTLALPDSDGADTFRRLHAAVPELPVLILSTLENDALATALVQQGAQDFLVKSELDDRLLLRAMRYAMERARIRRALAEERQLMATLLERVPDRIYFKDAQSRFLLINHALADLLGLADPKLAIGKSDADFFRPEHAQAALADEREVIRTGIPLVGKVERETRMNGFDSWVLTTKVALRDASGKIVGTFGVSRDIGEIKRAEEAVRDSEERYGRLLGAVMDYSYSVLIENGRPVSTTHSEGCVAVTGYTRAEYEANRELWFLMIHPDDRFAVIQNFNRILAGEPPEAIEHRLLHKNGTVRWVRNTPAPRYDEYGRVIFYDAVVADITERKEADEQLKDANAKLREILAELTRSHQQLKDAQLQLIQAEKMQSIGELAAGVAHEVKNPLAVLLLGLNCLAQQPTASEPAMSVILQEMANAVARADTVVTGLLDFARSRDVEIVAAEINEIVEHSLEYVRHLLVKEKITVAREFAAVLPPTPADARKLEQVFINLFTNACHAMPGGGTLTVRTSTRAFAAAEVEAESGDRSGRRLRAGDPVVVVEISDTGGGIPPEKLSRIFDPFFTTKPTGKGTGLGLTVTRKILDLHGGRIGIRNRDGGGVTVTLTLRCEFEAGEIKP